MVHIWNPALWMARKKDYYGFESKQDARASTRLIWISWQSAVLEEQQPGAKPFKRSLVLNVIVQHGCLGHVFPDCAFICTGYLDIWIYECVQALS